MTKQTQGVLMLVLKWIAFPIALLFFGYYVVGPRIGQVPLPFSLDAPQQTPAAPAQKQAAPDPTPPDLSDNTDSTSQKFSPPDVDVSVEPGAQFAVRQGDTFRFHRRSKKHHTRSSVPGAGAGRADTGAVAPGGSDGGGSTDGGGVNW